MRTQRKPIYSLLTCSLLCALCAGLFGCFKTVALPVKPVPVPREITVTHIDACRDAVRGLDKLIAQHRQYRQNVSKIDIDVLHKEGEAASVRFQQWHKHDDEEDAYLYNLERKSAEDKVVDVCGRLQEKYQ